MTPPHKTHSPHPMAHAMLHVPFFRHDIGAAELESIAAVFAQPILTTGDVVTELEHRLANYLGRRHGIAVTSCTAAMQILLSALGIGPGDEVITTPLTFIATATAIMQAGARPVLVDVEPDTGNIDATRIEAALTPRTKAILPVHLYGHMCDMRAIRDIADRHRIHVIEDCAHCLEGERDGIRPGGLSDGACFSFFATKNLTCGEGGAIVLDNDNLLQDLRLLRLHGMNKTAADRHREGYQPWDMVRFGWKYNMSNIEAAILLPQFERLERKMVAREMLAARYHARLADIPAITLPALRPKTRHARHLFVMWAPNREHVIAELKKRGVETTVNYNPIHLTSYLSSTLGYRQGDFPIAERLGRDCISLPFYPTMEVAAVDYVCDCLAEILKDTSPARTW